MKVRLKTVLMSHLSDVHYLVGDAKYVRIEFIKYLLLNNSNTNEEIDPEVEFQNFEKYRIERGLV